MLSKVDHPIDEIILPIKLIEQLIDLQALVSRVSQLPSPLSLVPEGENRNNLVRPTPCPLRRMLLGAGAC